jgi:hypothetical protein
MRHFPNRRPPDHRIAHTYQRGYLMNCGVAVQRTVNVLNFARDVMYGLFGVEALNRLFYLIAEHFQFLLEFSFRVNRHLEPPVVTVSANLRRRSGRGGRRRVARPARSPA